MAAGLAGQRGEAARSRVVGSSSRACVPAQTVTTVTAITMTTVSATGSLVPQVLRVASK